MSCAAEWCGSWVPHLWAIGPKCISHTRFTPHRTQTHRGGKRPLKITHPNSPVVRPARGSLPQSMMLAWCSTIVGLSLPEGMGTPRRAAGPLGPSAGSSIPPVAPHLHDRVLKVKLHSAVLKFARGNDALLPPDMQQDQRDAFALGTRAGLEKAYHVRPRPGFCLTPGCQNLVETHVHHGCTVLHAR